MKKQDKNSDIVIYRTKNNDIKLKVNLKKETLWLNLNQISELFNKDKSVISRHINNIYKSKELQRDSTVAFFATVQKEGKRQVKRNLEHFNLDVIISVGYRVNSKVGTKFRIWATNVLRKYLIEGYAINQKRLEQDSKKWKLLQLQIENLRGVLDTKGLTSGQSKALVRVITDYSKAFELLDSVDRKKVLNPKSLKTKNVVNLKYKELIKEIEELRTRLKVGELFGQDNNDGLESALKSINQSFDGKDVYPSVEKKAANLLYLIIKNHPFIDGNKRIGAFTFVRYLSLNDLLYRGDGTKSIEQDTLVAIALLIAQSNSKDKEIMIDLVTYLIGM